MTRINQGLPDFQTPPVVETVLGVEFDSLQGWDVRHFGLFAERVAADYPRFEVQPPLSPAQPPGAPPGFIPNNAFVQILGIAGPTLRAWYIHSSETRLLQVQEDRFLHNWRKVSGDEAYPHYTESIRPTFEREWDRFIAFLRERGVSDPKPRRWEVTYVNHLERGREWNSLSDLSEILALWRGGGSDGFLPAPDAVHLKVRYPLPGDAGDLAIVVQPVIRGRDQAEVIQINVTASGPVPSPDSAALFRSFDLGREWVVRGFADFTTAKMHHLWRREDRK